MHNTYLKDDYNIDVLNTCSPQKPNEIIPTSTASDFIHDAAVCFLYTSH